MRSKFVGIVTGFALLATALPAQAAGLTSAQVTAVVSLLQSFDVSTETISHVQSVLSGKASENTQERRPEMGMASSTPPRMSSDQTGKTACVMLKRDLSVGSQGDDVRELQKFLMSDSNNGFVGTTTGFFGPATARAVKRFQMENGIASSTTGNIGAATRGFFERRCGKGQDGERGRGMMGSTTRDR